MSVDLSLYSKQRLESFYKKPIKEILTEDVYFNDERCGVRFIEYKNSNCYLGVHKCIDDRLISLEIYWKIITNTISLGNCDCFDKEVKTFTPESLIKEFEKLKGIMMELTLNVESVEKIYRNYFEAQFVFPYYSNLIASIEWLKELKSDDEIILMQI